MELTRKIKNTAAGLAIGLSALVSGCNSNCPSCDGTLYTQSNIFSPFMNAQPGLDGYKLGMQDSHVPVNFCGFEYYGEHRGGYGDTLQMLGCDQTVYLEYAFDSLREVAVKEGWQGQTEKGLKLGDSQDRLKELYPNAKKRDIRYPDKKQNEIWTAGYLKISFKDGKANVMGVYPENFDSSSEETVDLIGPSEWRR